MKILFCIRSNYLQNVAGDTVQLLTCAKYLENRGVEVYINSGEIKDYSKYDIVHLFNLTRISETYGYYKIAKSSNKKIVITPIYWNLEKYYINTMSLNHIALWERNTYFRKEIIDGCSMIYPSSVGEMQQLMRDFGSDIQCTVVYNCIDIDKLDKQATNLIYDKNSYVLCVARVCPRKNQLALAKICDEQGQRLILVGGKSNNEYLEKCLKFKNVIYEGYLQSHELAKLYKNAKLHILCSFVETPGLSSLEAAGYGCNIISTSEGSTEEYFKNMALYCNPYDDVDIYNSIKTGLEENYQPQLQKHVLEEFNSQKCLATLYESYCDII